MTGRTCRTARTGLPSRPLGPWFTLRALRPCDPLRARLTAVPRTTGRAGFSSWSLGPRLSRFPGISLGPPFTSWALRAGFSASTAVTGPVTSLSYPLPVTSLSHPLPVTFSAFLRTTCQIRFLA